MFQSLILIFILFTQTVTADLRMASSPKKNFQVENANDAIPFVQNSIAFYMEPSDFNYQGLKNQRQNNYDNFLRSNIDNEQDNRNFVTEIGRDMLPFRTLEANSINNNVVTTTINQQTLIPLRWNNPHSSECEINIWIKSSTNSDIVVPIKKPSCCGEGYQDNMISFTIPPDFKQLASKIPGFIGCNKIGDCTLQIYAHSVEPRTYAIGSPLIVSDSNVLPGSFTPPVDNNQIQPATVDPQLNINVLPRDVCLPTTDQSSNYISAVPKFARLVSDQFNHAYQNSDFSPYSGQQHELISRNLQSATILRMTAANGGELGRSILSEQNTNFINDLIAKVNDVVQKYEKVANNIFNTIKDENSIASNIGAQQLANCFRCPDTGSVNTNRIEQQTYIPSFQINNVNRANQIRNMLKEDVKNLIPVNSNTVQIYQASLNEVSNDFFNAANLGFVYQPAMIKNTITTMEDPTNFLKVDANGNKDDGVYASTIASKLKQQNIDTISSIFNFTQTPPTTLPIPTALPTALPTSLPQPTALPPLPTQTNIYPSLNNPTLPLDNNNSTLPPNPDDLSSSFNFCGQTYETVDCNRPCVSGMDFECVTDTCFYTTKCSMP